MSEQEPSAITGALYKATDRREPHSCTSPIACFWRYIATSEEAHVPAMLRAMLQALVTDLTEELR